MTPEQLKLHIGLPVMTPDGEGKCLWPTVEYPHEWNVEFNANDQDEPFIISRFEIYSTFQLKPICRSLSSIAEEELQPIGLYLAGYKDSDMIDDTTEFPLHVWLCLINKGFYVGQYPEGSYILEDVK